MNRFGHNFALSLFGESHSDMVGVTLDGVRAGIALCVEDFEEDLARRRGGAQGTTPRRESDVPKIVSGIFNGKTTGAPLTLIFENNNTRSEDYESLKLHPRPSHADFVAAKKFDGFNDPRGGGHFSGRLTVLLVAAGVVAKKMIGDKITCSTKTIISREAAEGDSVGGVVECRVSGLPIGIGEPFFDSVESVMAHLLFSIPGVKGVEFGSGFRSAEMLGSEHNDTIIDASGKTPTNNAGGIVGGITNGNELVVRVAFKPTSSIALPQQTMKFDDSSLSSGEVEELKIKGRHDSCIAIRGAVVVEAAVIISLLNL